MDFLPDIEKVKNFFDGTDSKMKFPLLLKKQKNMIYLI